MAEKPTVFERITQAARFALLTAISVIAALILTAPRTETGLGNPFMMRPAMAEGAGGAGGGISAAPGYLMLTIGINGTDKFYIVDTNKQTICVYSVLGDKLRLVSARKFDFDSEIPEGSLRATGDDGRSYVLEAGNGFNREEAKTYSKYVKQAIEAAKPRK